MIKTFEAYKKKEKSKEPVKEEKWSDKDYDYSKFKNGLSSFLNQFVSDDNIIDNIIHLLHDKEFMKTANKDNMISDLKLMLTQAGVTDEKSLNKIEKEIREL